MMGRQDLSYLQQLIAINNGGRRPEKYIHAENIVLKGVSPDGVTISTSSNLMAVLITSSVASIHARRFDLHTLRHAVSGDTLRIKPTGVTRKHQNRHCQDEESRACLLHHGDIIVFKSPFSFDQCFILCIFY